MLLAEPGPPSTAAELLGRLRTRYPFDGLELSLQTTRDDLRLLVECGFPVVPLDVDGNEIDLDSFDSLTGRLKNVRWTLRDPARLGELHCEGLPRPSAADVLALDMLRCALGQCAPAGFWLASSVRRLLDEVAKTRPTRPPSAGTARGRVRVRLRVRASEVVEATSWLPALQMVPGEGADGWVRVEFEAPTPREAEGFVLGLGESVEVEEPAELRSSVCARLRLALANYSGGTAGLVGGSAL